MTAQSATRFERAARVYEKRDYSGHRVYVAKSGGSIQNLRSCNLNDQTRSLKINRKECGESGSTTKVTVRPAP